MEKEKLDQEDIHLTSEVKFKEGCRAYTSTDNITDVVGEGDSELVALMDHIVELILYYEAKYNNG